VKFLASLIVNSSFLQIGKNRGPATYRAVTVGAWEYMVLLCI
jgi:hypothetical protein